MLLTKLITAVIVATATILGFATAGVISERKLPAGLKSPLEGYAIAEPIFSGTILGQDYKLNGTVQQVYAQLEKVHGPKKLAVAFAAADIAPGNDTTTVPNRSDVTSNLNKRNMILPGLCLPIRNWGWEKVEVAGINDNIDSLRRTGGTVTVFGRHCVRISCGEDVGIWVCNDRNDMIRPGVVYLASYARYIMLNCWQLLINNHHLGYYSGGQLFDLCGDSTDNYSVILRKDYDCLGP